MGKTKLRVEQVLEERLRYASGEREYSKLARKFGVSRDAVRSAAEGADLTFELVIHLPERWRRLSALSA